MKLRIQSLCSNKILSVLEVIAKNESFKNRETLNPGLNEKVRIKFDNPIKAKRFGESKQDDKMAEQKGFRFYWVSLAFFISQIRCQNFNLFSVVCSSQVG